MSKVLKTKGQYLEYFQQDISDELDIDTGNSDNYADSVYFGLMKDKYFNKESFDEFAKRVLALPDTQAEMFESANAVADEVEETRKDNEEDFTGNIYSEMDGSDYEWGLEAKRLRALIEISQNFLANLDAIRKTDAYKKLEILIPDKDVTLLALCVEEMKMYAEDMLEIFGRNEEFVLDNFESILNKIKVLAKEIIEAKSRNEVVDKAYEMNDLMGDYIESLIDKTFEWDQEEINRANWFVNLLTEFEANWYFLLLIREEEIVREGLVENPNVDSRTSFYEDKQDLLSRGKALRDAGIGYTGMTSKNDKK